MEITWAQELAREWSRNNNEVGISNSLIHSIRASFGVGTVDDHLCVGRYYKHMHVS
jgi:hypothetical protein